MQRLSAAPPAIPANNLNVSSLLNSIIYFRGSLTLRGVRSCVAFASASETASIGEWGCVATNYCPSSRKEHSQAYLILVARSATRAACPPNRFSALIVPLPPANFFNPREFSKRLFSGSPSSPRLTFFYDDAIVAPWTLLP